jgi:hypothetical protein
MPNGIFSIGTRNVTQRRSFKTGRYTLVPNPCTTKPSLPDRAYAVEASGRCYYLTVAGQWSDQARTWRGWTPVPGDRVTVFGQVRRLSDVYGNPIFTIEVDSLIPGGA